MNRLIIFHIEKKSLPVGFNACVWEKIFITYNQRLKPLSKD